MLQWRWFKSSLFVVLLFLCTVPLARASQYYGEVTFGGLPVPGATVTATQGEKTISVTSDAGGVFHFDDLPDGQWKIEVKMLCFETDRRRCDHRAEDAGRQMGTETAARLINCRLWRSPRRFQPRRARS